MNASKTQGIIFSFIKSSKRIPTRRLLMQNNEIVILDKIKYLGITLDKYLTYKAHDDEATSKAIWCGRALYPLLNRKSRLSEKNKLLLYKVCMRPLLSYGCPYKKRLQIIQNKNLKII